VQDNKYTFLDLTEHVDYIMHQVIACGKPIDYIVGVVRGGAIPAVMLSHALNVPCKMVTWSNFHKDQGKEYAYDIAEDLEAGKRVLLVDDILDSGKTMSQLLDTWGNERARVDIAVLLYNEEQSIVPDYYGYKFKRSENKAWFDFWWEV
jgi:hypoxanthine phosphoribosyltransferase